MALALIRGEDLAAEIQVHPIGVILYINWFPALSRIPQSLKMFPWSNLLLSGPRNMLRLAGKRGGRVIKIAPAFCFIF